MMKNDSFTLPSLILCVPGIKQSSVKKYGYNSVMAIFRDDQEMYKSQNKTPLQVFQELPYKLGEDFSGQFAVYQGDKRFAFAFESRLT